MGASFSCGPGTGAARLRIVISPIGALPGRHHHRRRSAEARYDAGTMTIHFHQLGGLSEQATGRSWSPATLLSQVDRHTAALRKAGIEPGARLLLSRPGGLEFFADLLGAWRLGACVAVLDPAVPPAVLDAVVGRVRPRAVLRDRGEDPAIPAEDLRPPPPAPEAEAHADLDAPALILFTSGSTGEPKGVVHSFRSLLARATLNRAHLGDAVLARTLCVLPTSFGHGLIGCCLTPLLAGHELVLDGRGGVTAAAAIPETLEKHSISFVSATPSFWRLVLRLAPEAPATPPLALGSGSAPLPTGLWGDLVEWTGGAAVMNLYGLTETANWFSAASSVDGELRSGNLGTPWGGRFAVRSDDGELHPEGEGELVLLTPSRMSGYLGREDLTRDVLVDGWYRTGDQGVVEADGRARLLGRRDHRINRGGFKVHPEEVDLALEAHPDVEEACSFALPDPVGGETVGVAVRGRTEEALDEGTLRSWCTEQLRPEAVPARWFFLTEIPRSPRGKPDRPATRKACEGDEP